MCEHVRRFKLVYFDNDGQDFPEWNSEDEDYDYSSPLSVSVQLVLGDGDTEYTFSTEVILPMRRYRPAKR